MVKVRKEIHIIWNPSFKYGGPVSVEVKKYEIADDGMEHVSMISLSNGFWNKDEAWKFAEKIRENEQMPIINDAHGFGA